MCLYKYKNPLMPVISCFFHFWRCVQYSAVQCAVQYRTSVQCSRNAPHRVHFLGPGRPLPSLLLLGQVHGESGDSGGTLRIRG